MAVRAGMVRVSLALFAVVAAAACGTAVGLEGGNLSRPSMRRIVTTASTAGAPATSAPVARTATKPKPAVQLGIAPVSRAVLGPPKPFASVAGVTLVPPSDRVERIGFHQASDVDSQNLTPLPTAVRPKLLPTRHRPTGGLTAADIVVDPKSKLTAPVTGVVKKAGKYSLYCKYPDAFVVISPDGHPELEVKVLHISALRVRPGDRVIAGKTPIAWRATRFPFGSQVDAFTARPAWPHVHLEVTKLAVPDARPVVGYILSMGSC